jgi:hypothetical protein
MFDGGNHQRLVVNAPAFAARFPTHIGFVHLDVPIRLAADPILVGMPARSLCRMPKAVS